jgi:hypothetical protein
MWSIPAIWLVHIAWGLISIGLLVSSAANSNQFTPGRRWTPLSTRLRLNIYKYSKSFMEVELKIWLNYDTNEHYCLRLLNYYASSVWLWVKIYSSPLMTTIITLIIASLGYEFTYDALQYCTLVLYNSIPFCCVMHWVERSMAAPYCTSDRNMVVSFGNETHLFQRHCLKYVVTPIAM